MLSEPFNKLNFFFEIFFEGEISWKGFLIRNVRFCRGITLKKQVTSMSCTLEPAIQSCDSGQWISFLTAVNWL